MKHIKLTFLFFFLCHFGFGQVQKGTTRLMNSGKKPIAGVQVYFSGAKATQSDASGVFRLVFSGKKAGDLVFMEKIHKAGYELVNRKELEVSKITNTSYFKNDIILAYAGTIEASKKQYYKISDKALRASFAREKQALRTQLQNAKLSQTEFQKKYEELQKQFDLQQKNLDALAYKFARTNFDDVSKVHKEALELFKAGKIQEAADKLKEANLLQEADKIIEDKQRLEKAQEELDKQKSENATQTQQVIKALLDEASFNKLTYNFERVNQVYEKLLLLDSTNTELVFEIALFYQNQNRFQQAQRLYQSLLANFRAEGNLPDVAMTLNNLAVLLSDQGQFAEAKEAYQEALGIRRKLAEKNPEAYLPDVAMTLNNLAVLLKAQGQFAEAKEAYQEALGIYQKLAEKNPEAYLPYVGTTLNNLANLLSDQGQFSEAKSAYQEALDIYQKLAEKNPEAYLPDVAMTLNNLAVLLSAQGQFSEAKSAYQEALGIYRKLAEKNPEAYLPDVAMTLNNLAVLLSDQGQFAEAKAAYQEALGIYQKLAEKNPEAYLPDVAMTLNNLANLLSDQGQFAEAKAAYQEALGIYQKLAETNPEAYLPYVGTTLNNLGLLLSAQGQFSEAKSAYQEALGIGRKLYQTKGVAYAPGLASTMINLGIFYLQVESERDREKSIKLCQQAILIIRPMMKEVVYLQQYFDTAIGVLQAWNFDVQAWLESLEE